MKEVAQDEHADVDFGAGSFAESVIAVGVDHVVEGFSEFDESVDESFDDLDVGVGFAGAGDDEQFALETGGEMDGGGLEVAIGIDLRGAHVDFLKPGVVEVGLGFRDNGDSDVIEIWFAEHGVEGIGAAAAPAPYADAREIDEGVRGGEGLEGGGLFFGGEGAEAAEDASSPSGAFGGRGASIVDGEDEVAEVGHHTVKGMVGGAPSIEHGLGVRFAVDVDEYRVFFGRVEVGGLHEPGIGGEAVSEIELQELGGIGSEGLGDVMEVGIGFQDANGAMGWEFDQIDDGRSVEGRVGVEGEFGIGREVVVVGPGEILGSDLF